MRLPVKDDADGRHNANFRFACAREPERFSWHRQALNWGVI